MRHSATLLLFAATAAIAQPLVVGLSDYSISGTVTDASTGEPLAKRTVSAMVATRNTRGNAGSVETDILGKYKLSHLPPGDYVLSVAGDDLIPNYLTVTVPDGRDVKGIELAVQLASSISGTVMDSDKKPILSANLLLIQKLYRNGRVVYGQVAAAMGDLEGHYKLNKVPPGAPYLVSAKTPLWISVLSEEPEEFDKRLPGLMPAYYLNASFPEGALSITTRSGQSMEGADIQMERAKAYCVVGVTKAEGVPASLYIDLYESNLITVQPVAVPGRFYVVRHRANMTGADGRFRICGLHSGDYRLLATSESDTAAAKLFAAQSLSIGDHDATKIELNALPANSLPVEVAFDEAAPVKTSDTQIHIAVSPLQRGAGSLSLAVPLPGKIVATGLRQDEYAFRVDPPAGAYIKDVTYGNVSTANQTFEAGSAINGGLKIVLAGDGGTISAKVADSDGNSVPSANVWFLPVSAKTAAELETVLISCTTGSAGLCTSPTLHPDKYRVLATREAFTHSAADIDRLWGARLKGAEVDLAPQASAQTNLSPISVF